MKKNTGKFDSRIKTPSPHIVALLAEIDGIRGEFKSALRMSPQAITNLKKSTLIRTRQYDLSLVILFGSQSTGQTHRESDVDIAYRSDRDLTESEEVTINQKLSEISRMSEVDTVNLKTASPLLRRQILDSAQVLFDKTGLEFDQFELYALRSFAEAKPLFDLRREKINASLDNYDQSRTN